jgi:hypothetical protein
MLRKAERRAERKNAESTTSQPAAAETTAEES